MIIRGVLLVVKRLNTTTSYLDEYARCKVRRTGKWTQSTQPLEAQRPQGGFGCGGGNGPIHRAPTTPAEPGSDLGSNKGKGGALGPGGQAQYHLAVGALLHMVGWSRPDAPNRARELPRPMLVAGEACKAAALPRAMGCTMGCTMGPTRVGWPPPLGGNQVAPGCWGVGANTMGWWQWGVRAPVCMPCGPRLGAQVTTTVIATPTTSSTRSCSNTLAESPPPPQPSTNAVGTKKPWVASPLVPWATARDGLLCYIPGKTRLC